MIVLLFFFFTYLFVLAQLVRETGKIASTFQALIEVVANLIAEIDVLVSFAHVAAHSPGAYACPVLAEESNVHLVKARHPCLELQPSVDFVGNDHEMDKENSRFQILTGPNMGGKSTYSRQLGVICVMAQIGSYIPCEEGAKLPILDAILARVGAGDAQLKGISTFMCEMIEASNIVKVATSKSLIIIDELGRGTSTYDGFGLAWAISEYIVNKTKAYCIFATHFHELTVLEKTLKGVSNLHVAARYVVTSFETME